MKENPLKVADSDNLIESINNIIVGRSKKDQNQDDDMQPGTSESGNSSKRQEPLSVDSIRNCMDAHFSAEKMILEDKKSKAEIYKPTGMYMDDDDYFHCVAHIDKALFPKIEKGEYVDLAKLLPREKVLHPTEKMQLVNREGRSFFVPLNEKEPPAITSPKRWEQAFSTYAGIYIQKTAP